MNIEDFILEFLETSTKYFQFKKNIEILMNKYLNE